MDINVNVNVKFEGTPALINCFSAFSAALQATVGALAVATKTTHTAVEDVEPATVFGTGDASVVVIDNTVPVQESALVEAQVPEVVPTAPTHQYTIEEIQAACGPLMDAGKMNELAAILHGLGAASLLDLPAEKYGALAIKLRELGARL